MCYYGDAVIHFIMSAERSQKTLEKIGPAVLHGAMSTLLAVLILVMSKSLTMYLFFVVSLLHISIFIRL